MNAVDTMTGYIIIVRETFGELARVSRVDNPDFYYWQYVNKIIYI